MISAVTSAGATNRIGQGQHCVRCFAALVSVRDAAPWCPACQWGLDVFEPDRRPPELGIGWVDRRLYRLAHRLTRGQFVALADRGLQRAGFGAAGVALIVASVLLLGLVLGCAGLGVWLLAFDFPNLTIVPGLVLLGAAVLLRPRLGRVDGDFTELDREDAPALFALIEQVAEATGAPVPDHVGIDSDFQAYTTAVGLRQRRLLCLGLPLFSALPPQQRVALLGHELGHFVNGDVRRGLLTQVAFTTLGNAADILRPPGYWSWGSLHFLTVLPELLTRGLQWLLSRLLLVGHLGVVWLGLRDGQRAEYLADELAARAAGSTDAAAMLDSLVLDDPITMVVCREARVGGLADRWRVAADEVRRDAAHRLPVLRQLSVRDETSMFASHPPTGLRVAMVLRRPHQTPAVVLSEAQSQRIDAELARHAERTRRELTWLE